jgi:hypothetical protein
MGPDVDRHPHPGGPGWPDGSGGPGWHGGPGWPDGPRWHGGPGWDGSRWDGGPWWDWWPLLPTLMFALLVLTGMVLLSRRGAAILNRTPLLGGTTVGADPVAWWRARWMEAGYRYRATAQAYAEFECDVREVLRLPALADVTQPATARFVDAFAEAGALCTERFPGAEFAQRFISAVEHAERSWGAAVDAAERMRAARFGPGERRLIEQVTALLDLALSSPHAAERRTAYQRAVSRLTELERRTGWQLPRPAVAALEHRARAALCTA